MVCQSVLALFIIIVLFLQILEDFGGFDNDDLSTDFDLMDDTDVPGVYDPLLSSPHVPVSPYDSPSSLHDVLMSSDHMEITS